MPGIVLNPSGARRPALKAMSPRAWIAAHPKLLGPKPSSVLSATLVKVYGGAVCAHARDSTAPSTRPSAVKRANISAKEPGTDGRLWVTILPPCVDHVRAGSFCRRSLSLLCPGKRRRLPVYTQRIHRTDGIEGRPTRVCARLSSGLCREENATVDVGQNSLHP